MSEHDAVEVGEWLRDDDDPNTYEAEIRAEFERLGLKLFPTSIFRAGGNFYAIVDWTTSVVDDNVEIYMLANTSPVLHLDELRGNQFGGTYAPPEKLAKFRKRHAKRLMKQARELMK